jgi:hypothetical protein
VSTETLVSPALSPHASAKQWPIAIARVATPGYALLLVLALAAFWPGYLALPKRQLGFWVHYHATTATLWMLVLIIQPYLAASGRYRVHRAVGRASLVLAAAVLVGFAGLAHAELVGISPADFGVQAYFGYVRLVIVAAFAGCYVLGVVHRHNTPLHARYMFCTGLSVIDPIFHRLAARLLHYTDHNYQLFTFGLVAAVLLMLIAAERRATTGRQVFPAVLSFYVVGGLPLAFDFYTWGPVWTAWKSAVAGFAALPIP